MTSIEGTPAATVGSREWFMRTAEARLAADLRAARLVRLRISTEPEPTPITDWSRRAPVEINPSRARDPQTGGPDMPSINPHTGKEL